MIFGLARQPARTCTKRSNVSALSAAFAASRPRTKFFAVMAKPIADSKRAALPGAIVSD